MRNKELIELARATAEIYKEPEFHSLRKVLNRCAGALTALESQRDQLAAEGERLLKKLGPYLVADRGAVQLRTGFAWRPDDYPLDRDLDTYLSILEKEPTK